MYKDADHASKVDWQKPTPDQDYQLEKNLEIAGQRSDDVVRLDSSEVVYRL